jgi:hypothetical protein
MHLLMQHMDLFCFWKNSFLFEYPWVITQIPDGVYYKECNFVWTSWICKEFYINWYNTETTR